MIDSPRIIEAARSGDGVGWHEHNHDVHEGCERFFRPGYNAQPASPTGCRRSTASSRSSRPGRTVADIGCGHGASTILMAQAFPNSTFVGSDYHDGLDRDRARSAPREAGVADRVTLRGRAGGRASSGDGYDLVTMFDCLHDMGDPVGAARHVRGRSRPTAPG